MKRQAPKGDFRSNLHRGGQAKGIKPTALEQATAVRAAQALGLGVAGVDLIRSARGPLVLEVNASPGLEGIEEATGVDVAGAVVEHVAEQLQLRSEMPDVSGSYFSLATNSPTLAANDGKSVRRARKRLSRPRRA